MKILIKGLRTRLLALTGVTSIVGQRVYTDVPQAGTFPYISLDISGDESYRKGSRAQTFQVVINSWSRVKNMDEADDIIQACRAGIDRQESTITLDSGSLVRLDFVSEDCFKDPDGVTWHGISIYNAYVDLGG